MSINEVHFLIDKTTGQNCLYLSSGFRNISRDVRMFLDRDFLLLQVMNHVCFCVVWLLTRKIMGSNLALVISFFEWILCGFSLVSPGKCQNCISNWAITASFHILEVSADHKEKGSGTFPGTSLWFFPPFFKQKILYSGL